MGLFKSLKGSHPSNTNNLSPQQPTSSNPPYKPPPYAPPSSSSPTTSPPPYHDWQSISDTSLLSPPPSFAAHLPNTTSTFNASFSAAAAGHNFCAHNSRWRPSVPNPKMLSASHAGRIGLQPAAEFRGKVELKATGGGRFGEIWHVESTRRCPDANLMSGLPMYFAAAARDDATETQTIYYEVRIVRMRAGADAAIAVGYAAKPYPGWRLPGWHRGSVGVHGDDGRRFVNDSFGGVDFVEGWREGGTVGIGMRVGGQGCRGEVFFTRNGEVEGRWWVDEERDAERQDGGVEGLRGEGDLYLCVGCFGQVEFEVVLERGAWLYRGDGS